MFLRLTKGWALVGVVAIVFGAGVLHGLLVWSSGSLIPRMIGHIVMDIGLFAYWWTGIAGEFTARRISETGVDQPFLVTCATLATTLIVVPLAVWRIRRMNRQFDYNAIQVDYFYKPQIEGEHNGPSHSS